MKSVRTSRGSVTREVITIDCEDMSLLNWLRVGSPVMICEEVMKFQFPQQVTFIHLPAE
jgi:hypothetical protein